MTADLRARIEAALEPLPVAEDSPLLQGLYRRAYASRSLIRDLARENEALQAERVACREIFMRWWFGHQEDSQYFNELVRADKILATQINDMAKEGDANVPADGTHDGADVATEADASDKTRTDFISGVDHLRGTPPIVPTPIMPQPAHPPNAPADEYEAWGLLVKPPIKHERACAWVTRDDGTEWQDPEESCTCGYEWRVRLSTYMTLYNAWRKRAEEAENAVLEQGRRIEELEYLELIGVRPRAPLNAKGKP